jgi:hypothetical protein
MASTYLTRTPSSTGNRKTWTWSSWCKFSQNTTIDTLLSVGADSSNRTKIIRNNVQNGDIRFLYSVGAVQYDLVTSALYRDVSGWYHIVVAVDTTQATSSDRVKIYINGEQITSFSTANYLPQNTDTDINTTNTHYIGRYSYTASNYMNGSMSHVHFIDGTAYDASAFGETDATTGEWVGKTSPSVTYGTNGFFILKDGNGITDQSGEGNDFTLGGGTLTDLKDNPDNVFATANPLIANGNIDYSNGNTNSYHTYSGQWRWTASTLGASTGKYYSEYKISAIGSEVAIGIMDLGQSTGTTPSQNSANDFVGKFTNSISYVNSGTIYKANSDLQGSVTTYTTNDIIGVAMDLDNNTVQFYKNGSTVGTAVSITSGLTYNIGVAGYGNARILWNTGNGYFGTTAVSSAGTNASGNGIFEYDVPTGYTALSTKGLNL